MLKLLLCILLTLQIGAVQAQAVNPLLLLSKERLKERRDKIIQDNEFVRNEVGRHTNIHVDCLLLNGVPFDVALLDTKSWGLISLVRGKPGSPEQEHIPFRAYLRRGDIVMHNAFFQNPVYEVSISKVLSGAKPGDVIIVEPVRDEDYKAKRVLKLID
ncbi:hypothetical protein [Imperialibacter roseus]|uniref:Uncharacterized protein n=1 Tax=Imperialibacter roseus TaxID=1324217 RepID=A0ABZ0INE5_9BACT|nr:hypothetical protein [Imperialibacter roseus]WOK06558.1 hypothetical protein RT717_26135 [Imperialibacter roseus]|tara:strand:- start:7445 stop:7918 length:474 start_codon:yes stop_codon:yes gene_type:complete